MKPGYYTGKVKVVCEDMMCFPADRNSLKPLACSIYDPYAWTDPEDAVETITYGEWLYRLNELRGSTSHELHR